MSLPARVQLATPLASKTFEVKEPQEVGLEVEARAVGASWAQRGAEAAALLVNVDGAYSGGVFLFAGDAPFTYRVMLGRLPQGKHSVSIALNPARSAIAAHRAQILAVRPLMLAADKAEAASDEIFALAHSPFLYAR